MIDLINKIETMTKLITRDQKIDLKKINIYPADLPNNAKDIKLVGNDYIDLINLNLNIVKYESDNIGPYIHIVNCNINKLVLNTLGRGIVIFNSNIQNIYIQSEIESLRFINTNIPNLHGRVDLIDTIAKTD